MHTKLTEDVVAILARSEIAGNVLKLPEQLDRETYLRVNKALVAARGKWDRKAKGHVFPFDPRELIGDVVETASVVDAKKTLQFFETPDALALRMVQLAAVAPNDIVLEPSAGLGRIVRHLLAAGTMVDAVEIDETNCKALRELPGAIAVAHGEFEPWAAGADHRYNAVVMNPPFANNQDVRHIRQAWDLLRPGGRLVAICCEGPFFRADRFAVQFRDWLDKIGAETEKLPHGTFRESGTDVATRLLWATKAGPEAQLRALWTAEGNDPARQDAIVADITAKAAPGAAVGPFRIAGEVRAIPLTQVESDPGQPRKTFEEGALRELAASIRENGLLQPISVREIAPDRFCIVAGERRFRAHQLLGAATVPAIVIQTAGAADIRVKQIIENDQRADVPPLEQARSYQALMDETGWTVEQLAARVGKAPWRIRERTALLALQPEYQGLLASGNLKPSEAAEMARLATPRAQATLFTAIRTGACRTYNDLRATATALANVEAQPAFTLAAAPPPTEAERSDASAFEAQVERVSAMLRAGIDENRVVAVKKVSPHRAGHLADLLGAMQGDLRRIELGLRTAAVQASFLEA